jgi:hypothetical protein
LDSQGRAAFEDIEFLTVYAFGELLQKLWLPLTAGVVQEMNRGSCHKKTEMIGFDYGQTRKAVRAHSDAQI